MCEFQENISLKDFTTYKIGGNARYFFVASSEEDLISAIKKARQDDLPFFLLGGGSNILFSDNGFDGLVIKLEFQDIKVENNIIYAGAGVLLKKAVDIALDNELTGLEWATGIYGTVGGAVRGNAGAFGKFASDITHKVKVLKIDALEAEEMECYDAGYRDSCFKRDDNLIILSASFELQKGDKNQIKQEMDKTLKYRIERHPLNFPSAGSVFKNILYEDLEIEEFKDLGFVPAGYLIEQAGLKGKIIGGAQVSEKHANFIVNINNARAQDVKDLIDLVKETILEKYNINMEEEIVIL
jgi:UDP-N-acetylmuramate dehydrogenase